MTELNSTIIWTIIYAIATVVIAVYAWRSHQLSKRIAKQQSMTNDLYKAIVVATLMSGTNIDTMQTDMPDLIRVFNLSYDGEVDIFKKKMIKKY